MSDASTPVAIQGWPDLSPAAATAALGRAREAWAAHLRTRGLAAHPAAAARWCVLSATTKSQVFRLQAGGSSRVLKRYAEQERRRFDAERLALRLLRGSVHVPRLLDVVPSERMLLLPDLPESPPLDDRMLGTALGDLHGRLQPQQATLRRACPGARVQHLLERPPGRHQAVDPAALRRYLRRVCADFGPDYVGVALEDIKPGNLRGDGRALVLIDRESLLLGGYEALDLLLLSSLLPGRDPDDPHGAGTLPSIDWGEVLRAYCARRDGLGGYPWDHRRLARASLEVAVGLGFCARLVDEFERVAGGHQ